MQLGVLLFVGRPIVVATLLRQFDMVEELHVGTLVYFAGLAGVGIGNEEPHRPAVAAARREPLMRLCARDLVAEKDAGGRALDRVARFHLSNGARVERLNWLADRSDNGMAQSAGMMINYRYRLDHIEANHEAYTGRGEVAASSSIRSLLKG